MAKRQFYIIGHNPNTVEEAKVFLDAGANALEPDVKYDHNSDTNPELNYFISEDHGLPGAQPHDAAHSLVRYLKGLALYCGKAGNEKKLALIAFDTKDPVFDINEFLDIVRTNFTSQHGCEGTAILVTAPSLDNAPFLNACRRPQQTAGVGIDGVDNPRRVLATLQSWNKGKMTYACGTSFGVGDMYPTNIYRAVSDAKGMQVMGNGDAFRLVYAWTLQTLTDMRNFLDLHADGCIVEHDDLTNGVGMVLGLINNPPYNAMFDVARSGHDPFSGPMIDAYVLTVKTRDTWLGGTDSKLTFTLTGKTADNAIHSLRTVIDSNYDGMMETGQTNIVTVEGMNIGTITGLKLESDGSRSSSDWEPESIVVTSPLLRTACTFTVKRGSIVSPQTPLTLVPDA